MQCLITYVAYLKAIVVRIPPEMIVNKDAKGAEV